MPKLHRLDLSNNRIKTRLRRVLDSIVRPLTFLRLAGCGLTVTDLIYLSYSHHSTNLVELDISENNLQPCFRQVAKVQAIISFFHLDNWLCISGLEMLSL